MARQTHWKNKLICIVLLWHLFLLKLNFQAILIKQKAFKILHPYNILKFFVIIVPTILQATRSEKLFIVQYEHIGM
jgi:hypothetical protein